MNNSTIRLYNKKILITGVSRPLGIGATLAKRFAEAGAEVAVHGFSDYDLHVGHKSAMPKGTETVVRQLADLGLNVTLITPSDLALPNAAEAVVEEASQKLDGLDGLVLNHTWSTSAEFGDWTAELIDPHLTINIRASMLMMQSFMKQADILKDNAITLFTSGQYLGHMKNEMAYCVSKEAIICLCRQGAWELGDKNIRVNCVNPGPNDTGYCFG